MTDPPTEDVDLGALIHAVTERCRATADEAASTIEVDAPRVVGRWDELRLEQVVVHLLENALKFGGGKPIHVQVRELNGVARLTVRDEGIGIASADLPRIFEPFHRAVSEWSYGGLGLGLYMCARIVAGMRGTIDVHSEPGRGSTFTVDLSLDTPPIQ